MMHALVDALLSNLEAKRAAYAHMHDGAGSSSSGSGRMVEAIRNARTHLFVCNNCHYLKSLLNESVVDILPPSSSPNVAGAVSFARPAAGASGARPVVATHDMFSPGERLVDAIDAGEVMDSVLNRFESAKTNFVACGWEDLHEHMSPIQVGYGVRVGGSVVVVKTADAWTLALTLNPSNPLTP